MSYWCSKMIALFYTPQEQQKFVIRKKLDIHPILTKFVAIESIYF